MSPGLTIRVGFYPNTPEVYANCYRNPQLGRNPGCPYPGWCIETVMHIIQYMNATMQPVMMQPMQNGTVDWGIYINESWTGALGAIAGGVVDTVCLMYQPTNLRSAYFDFSTSVVSARPVFVVKEPEEELNDFIGKVFRTFQTQLWAMFVLVIFIQCVVMIVCYWLEAEVMSISVFRPFYTAWQIFRFFIVQPHGKYRRRTYGGNILMSVCAVATLLFTSLYQGLLLTRLLDPPDQVPFTNADQMIESLATRKYSLITNYRNNWFFDELTHSNWSYFEKIRLTLKENPVTYVDSVDEALDQVESGKYIYPTQEDSFTMFEATKRCSLVFIETPIPTLFVSFAFRKQSPILKRWNKAMVQTQAFQVKTFDRYMRDPNFMASSARCQKDPNKLKKLGQGLTAFDLLGAFLLILAGFVTSTAVLAAEVAARNTWK